MKRLYLILTIALVLAALCAPVFAQVPPTFVICQGLMCGGAGPSGYQYQVIVLNATITTFNVAVGDPNFFNYRNLVMPPGWSVNMVGGGQYIMGVFNPHGNIHVGATWPTQSYLSFTGPAIAGGTFGFDHDWPPLDADWQSFFAGGGNQLANWNQPVGIARGPVHAPMYLPN